MIGGEDNNKNNKNNKNLNEYEHVNMKDDDDIDGDIANNVLEEVSVEHNDIETYLEPQGVNNQIELSFSSQGLRNISFREVV